LRADSPASIDIVGVKLIDKDSVSVEFEVTNNSDQNIGLDCKEHANIWVRTAGLNGNYFWDDPVEYCMEGDANYRPQITIYFTKPSPIGGNYLNWDGSYQTPAILKPGEKKNITIAINIGGLLQGNFMTALSKDVWVRASLFKSGGEPTREETQELMKQYHLVSASEYDQIQAKLLNKYAPIEVAHGHLYKLEMPEAGRDDLVLRPISEFYQWTVLPLIKLAVELALSGLVLLMTWRFIRRRR
jgi:hypothetical protein